MSASDAIEKLWRRMLLVVGRGRITTGNDAGMVQTQQVQIGELETRDNTKRVAEYGFTSMPLPGCHAVVIFVGGDRSNGVIIGTNDQNARMKNLQPGEVAIYDDQGQSVYITRSGIVINGGGKPIEIENTPQITADTPLLRTTGDLLDNCNTNTVTVAHMRQTYNSHTHNENNVAGGPTATPNQSM
ncbi:phage baseplate assembly protein V [Variovorax ureilyticus]|uniref:phage baseplate assembly protein V n=1 Tax=Variovorax ureilyticus TaxID=1836198 RepID=UPI003D669DD3